MFGALLKVAGLRGEAPTPVAAVNYLLAAAICGLLATGDRAGFRSPPVLVVGGLAGLGFVIGFFVYYRVIERAGLSVAQPITGMSVLIPTLASILIWQERPTVLQVSAMVGVCLALLLLSSSGSGSRSANGGSGAAMPLLLALFVIQGVVMTAPKALEELGQGAHRWPYLTVLFAAAGTGALLRWRHTGERLSRAGAGIGIALGSVNVAATALMLAAIAALPGIVVFPLSSVGPMVLGTGLGIAVWGERPARRAMAGALLAVPAVFMLSL